MLDPAEGSAVDLAAANTQRWEIELAFDEHKTHQRDPRTVLRSKSPELVQQEIWGHLCCHYAIRSLMVEAAEHRGHDPDRVSFVAALRITEQTVAQPGAFPLTSTAATAPAGWSSSGVSCDESTPPAAAAQRHASSSARCPKWHVKRRPPRLLAATSTSIRVPDPRG